MRSSCRQQQQRRWMLSPNARCCLTCVLLPSTRQVETRATGVERETGQREMEHMGAQVRGGGGGGGQQGCDSKTMHGALDHAAL